MQQSLSIQDSDNGSTANNTLSNIQGIISILPTIIHDPMIQFMTVPLFLVLKTPPSEIPCYQGYSTTNPNAIVVHNSQLNDQDVFGQDSAQEVWVARTIAMYAQAVTSMNNPSIMSRLSASFRRMPPARL